MLLLSKKEPMRGILACTIVWYAENACAADKAKLQTELAASKAAGECTELFANLGLDVWYTDGV